MPEGAFAGGKAAHEQPVAPAAILPVQIIRIYNEDEWEQFILEWADGFSPKYHLVDRLGGAGDKGRDVVGYTGDPTTACAMDLYQCKHYGHALMPSDIWVELGKLCVYSWRGDYRIPRKYRFVAPQGVGTTLHDLLTKPKDLRAELMKKWDTHVRGSISSKESFPLEGALRAYVEGFNFATVGYEPPNAILEQHSRTPHWQRRFKRDYPARPAAVQPPTAPEARELPYVTELLGAYSEHVARPVPDVASLDSDPELRDHFQRSRVDFFMADGLNRFYRDQFLPGAFDDVKKQILDGVIDTARGAHENGYRRVQATTQQAVQVQLAQTDYVPYVQPSDRKGICHHLVNDEKLKWISQK